MIAYISGPLAEVNLEEGMITVEAGSVGYGIRVPGTVLDALPTLGEQVRIYTHLQVREDDMSLYGFLTKEDRSLFRQLLAVNGIGPKAAIGILSAVSPEDLRFAILAEDEKTIGKVPGIGPKTAKKLILELKDKFTLEEAFVGKSQGKKAGKTQEEGTQAGLRKEAVEALVALGYSATDATRAVQRVSPEASETVEGILKESLRTLTFL